MRRERNPLLTAYAVIIYVLLFAPIAILILFSFNDSRRTLRWHGFTPTGTGAFRERRPDRRASSSRSRWRVSPSSISTVLARCLGWGWPGYRFRARAATETLLLLPMVTPEIVMGCRCCCSSSRRSMPGVVRPAVDRAHHVLHLVRGGRRPGAGGEHGPRPGGGGP